MYTFKCVLVAIALQLSLLLASSVRRLSQVTKPIIFKCLRYYDLPVDRFGLRPFRFFRTPLSSTT